ncbi:MAG: selenide, water dikinase SelD [Pararhodobacter sp.]
MHSLPLTRDLVLIGGGHAHALVLRDWAMAPLPGARLTLIDPQPVAPYTGMLPGHIAGHYPRAALEIDLVRLARRAGARLIIGRAEGLEPAAGRVHVAGRPPVRFDIASLDIGITSDLPAVPGFAEHGLAVKPLGGYALGWQAFVAEVEAEFEIGQRQARIVVIGAGVGGIELALAMDHRLRHVPGRRITLIDAAPQVLADLGARARRRLLGLLVARRIDLRTGARVQSVGADHVRLESGECLAADLTLGAAGARPQPWLAQTGLQLSEGFITVDAHLRSVSHPQIFAAGDCAHMAQSPRPKAGVFAVRQAPVLADNLRAALSGGRLRRYRPQRDYLKLISLGGRVGLADKWGLALHGRWLWVVKDRIDARFMAMFHHVPPMPAPKLPQTVAAGVAEALGDKPLCGGCGAKVGPGPLRAALAALPGAADAPVGAVALGLGDDAAVLRFGDQMQVIATDHLRAFTEDPWLMARIAATHALGDIWAMGAAPQVALASLTLPRLSEALQTRTLHEIMQGAAAVFAEAGATIAGGHTAQGAELSIGFTVTGMAGARLLTKAGARPGEALILTKPLGSGTLLAAEMAGRAQARDIAALWPLLTQPQGRAATILAPHAGAMTDVTGFGLAGHLHEIALASGVSARIDLGALPLMDGAEALAAAGVTSSIAPANRAALAGQIAAPDTPRAALIFDPQTAGGLLASVPQALATRLVQQLRDAGYTAAVIGCLREAGDGPALRVLA